jgi:hypothetical protein
MSAARLTGGAKAADGAAAVPAPRGGIGAAALGMAVVAIVVGIGAAILVDLVL